MFLVQVFLQCWEFVLRVFLLKAEFYNFMAIILLFESVFYKQAFAESVLPKHEAFILRAYSAAYGRAPDKMFWSGAFLT